MFFDNLRIRAWLATPVIGDYRFPLDAMLAHFAWMRQHGPPVAYKPGVAPAYNPDDVPIKRYENSGDWFYCCSFAQWTAPYSQGVSFWNKRLDSSFTWRLPSRSVETRGGQYKSKHTRVFYRHAEFIEWHCVGDLYKIADLLKDILSIGKYGVQGWGFVNQWEINKSPTDQSILNADKQPMRAIPLSLGLDINSTHQRNYGIRPPYWLESNQRLCALPEMNAV